MPCLLRIYRIVLTLFILLPATSALANDLDALAPSSAVKQHGQQKEQLGAADRKLSGPLRQLLRGGGPATPPRALAPLDLVHEASRASGLQLRIAVTSVNDGVLRSLGRHGVNVLRTNQEAGIIEGIAGPDALQALASLPFVRSVRPVLPGRTRTGSVTTEGDAAAGAPAVRAQGYDGTGITVGVISDGIDSLGQAQATGDLGAVTVPVDPRCSAGDGDEGTALLEIVHDLAPGANLLFSGGLSPGAFADAVRCLTDAGADVIVDDIGFFDEPFFADGPVATAARAAVNAGVSFHSAAGNEGEEHYEAPYRPSSTTTFHDFNGGPVDNTDDMLVAPFDTVLCVLQWDDAFGHSANDYDLYLLDAGLNIVAASVEVQSGTQDPLEFTGVVNTTASTQILKVVVDKYAGASRRLEMFCLGGAGQQYSVPQGSIFGHPAVPEVVAVGAMDVLDPGLNDVEDFSSRGPASVSFPSSQVRAKPDLVAFDGVSISNAGGFPLCPPYCDFFGTSAAAPHSAAVAALLLSKNGLLSPADVRAALTQSAVDIGPAGFDAASGFGRIRADAAAQLVPEQNCSADVDCDDQSVCTVDACDAGVCVHEPVTCSDGDACNGLETCDPSSGCAPGTPPVCDDGDVCNGIESCDAGSGCVAGIPLGCGDGDACNGEETCDPSSGCAPGTPPVCDDGDVCNGIESCDAGTGCVPGAPLDCDDDDVCNGGETCDPLLGCTDGVPLTCGDDNECTTDTCDAASGCHYDPIGGFPGLDCELGRLLTVQVCDAPLDATTTAVMAAKIGKARAVLMKASIATKLGKERKLLKKTDKQLRGLQRKLTKLAHKGSLDGACSSALVTAIGDRRSVLGGLRP